MARTKPKKGKVAKATTEKVMAVAAEPETSGEASAAGKRGAPAQPVAKRVGAKKGGGGTGVIGVTEDAITEEDGGAGAEAFPKVVAYRSLSNSQLHEKDPSRPRQIPRFVTLETFVACGKEVRLRPAPACRYPISCSHPHA